MDVSEEEPPEAAIYARQSKDRLQGIKAQVDDCTTLCGLRGWHVKTVITDNDVSATSKKERPGYRQLLGMIEAGQIDVVAVTHVDRLLRKLAELEDLIELAEKHKVAIVTVSGDLDLSNDAGRTVGRILAVIARGEVERKGSRQKRANRQSAGEGKPRMGTPPPFGWLADRVTADPAEQAAVANACRALLAGGTLTGVARDWGRRGLRPRQAPFGPLTEDPWTYTSVRTILSNPRIAGIAVYKGAEVARGKWEPLVREEVWRATVQVMGGKWQRRTQGITTLLGGIGLCRCGNYLTGSLSARGLPSYRCNQMTRGKRPGPHVSVIRAPIDEAVAAAVKARMAEDDAVGLLAPQAGGDAAALRDEELALRSRLARLGALYAEGKIGEADLVSGREHGEARLAAILGELAELGRENVLAPLVMAEDPAAAYDALTLDRRRVVVDTLMTVTLFPSGAGARKFDPAKVLPIGRGITWKGGG